MTGQGASSAERAERTSIALACATTVLLRLPWLARPLSSDEAGALVAARVWASGGRLYTDLFIDRPQGFVLPYLLADAFGEHRALAVRTIGLLAGVATVLASAAVARSVAARPGPAVAAAWLAAVLGSSAAIEGYAANGELLAAAVAIPAMAVAARVATRSRAERWMLLAGLLAGAAATVKQSGGDVALAIVAWWALAAWRGWVAPRRALATLGWFALGLAVAPAVAAAHGATLGWDRYAYALVGFRLHARSAAAGPQLVRLAATLLVATALFGVPTWLAVRRARAFGTPWRDRLRPPHLLVLCWAAAASLAFAVGGNYHRHYWVQLAFPVAVAVGLALGSAAAPGALPPTPAQLRPAIARAAAVPVAIALALAAAPRVERDPRLDRDQAVLAWARAERPPGQRDLLPLCAEVTYDVDAGLVPRYPYVWVDHVRDAHGARDQLVELLRSPERPHLVALFQPLGRCDPDGRVADALDGAYHRVATVEGVEIYETGRSRSLNRAASGSASPGGTASSMVPRSDATTTMSFSMPQNASVRKRTERR